MTDHTLEIPPDLYNRLEERIEGTEFSSVEEYVRFILEEVVSDDEDQEEHILKDEDEEKIKERLQGLGYL